ncbi:MAG TPA: DUF4870 domain-containing protein [Kiritimatiellae bacterium]|nr:DUF4870 domain-containing protein [Kiritimatiellia bacterium]
MNEEIAAQPSQDQPTGESGQPSAAEAAAVQPMEQKEIEEGKPFAILSYALNFVGLPFFLVPLIMRNNEFSLYHAKQNLVLWLVGIVGGVISGVLILLCVGVLLFPLLTIFLLVLNVVGLINAIKGEAKPLPVIGKWGEDWFKGLRKS